MKRCTREILCYDPVDFVTKDHEIAHETSFIQDLTHIKTKCRNRMLKPSIMLPMGTEQVSVAHLKILISTVAKEVHGLVRNDICPEDRRNFRSLQKCFDDRVLDALQKYVDGSQGTIMYLKMCRQIYSAFTDTELKPLERIKLKWHATYFIRAWRAWLLNDKDASQLYNIHDNFLSSPAYSCIELNAYLWIAAHDQEIQNCRNT